MPDTPEDTEYGRTTAWERIAREEEHPEPDAPRDGKARRRDMAGRVKRLVRPLTDRIRRSS